MKPQAVRLLDMWLLGPLMVLAAGRAFDLNDRWRAVLALAGLLTVAYNGENWLRRRHGEA